MLWSALEKKFRSTLIPQLREKAEQRRIKHLKARTHDANVDSWRVRQL